MKFIAALPDGPQDTNYGLMAGLVRLPIEGEDILVFSNVDSPAGRKNGQTLTVEPAEPPG